MSVTNSSAISPFTLSTTASAPLCRGGQLVSEEQAAVVDHVLAHRVTVSDAGAGAGKTQTTVAATFELLTQRPTATIGQFALITFTNKAADELKRRLAKAIEDLLTAATSPDERQRWALAQERLGDAYIGTIHGFCRLILKTFGYGAIVARLSDVNFAGGMLFEAIESSIENKVLSAQNHPLRATLHGDWRIFDLHGLITDIYQDLRNCGLDPDKVAAATARQNYGAEDSGRDFRVELAKLVADSHHLYAKKKADVQKLDSTDLLLQTANVLSGPHGPAIIRKLTARYRYLFVDEFQDTDPVQERIVSLLEPQLEAMLLVGDGKQSIYGFRGADLSLESLAMKKTGQLPLRLSISRRPTEQLLNAYNALFDSMSKPIAAFSSAQRFRELGQPLKPFEKTLQATNKLPPIAVLNAGVRDDRGAGIDRTARAVRKLLCGKTVDTASGQRSLEAGDVAILFRKNGALTAYAKGLRAALRPDNIEVRTETGGRFFHRPEVVGFYRLLRFLLEYPNDVVTMQALRTPYLDELPDIEGSILWYGRRRGHELTNKFELRNPELAKKFAELRSALRRDTVPELLGRMDEMLGLREYHRRNGDTNAEDGLERLRELARSMTKSEQALTAGAFARYLSYAIRNDAEGPALGGLDQNQDRRPPYVRLMTIHAAKGLEFPIVIIPEISAPVRNAGSSRFVADESNGLDVRIPQLKNSLETQSPAFWNRKFVDRTAAIFEEMRIFYVAVTRAQNHVVLVGADTGVTHSPQEKVYSWQDEVLFAKSALQTHGCYFEKS